MRALRIKGEKFGCSVGQFLFTTQKPDALSHVTYISRQICKQHNPFVRDVHSEACIVEIVGMVPPLGPGYLCATVVTSTSSNILIVVPFRRLSYALPQSYPRRNKIKYTYFTTGVHNLRKPVRPGD